MVAYLFANLVSMQYAPLLSQIIQRILLELDVLSKNF